MYPELEIPFQQNISEEFLTIVNQLRESEEPGRVFELSREPTKDELKFLTAYYKKEIALVRLRQKKDWKMIEGTYDSVTVPTIIDETSDISTHYHPLGVTLLTDAALPSLEDVIDITPNAENFIITSEGLTYFSEIKKHPITGSPWKPLTLEALVYVYKLFRNSDPNIDGNKSTESSFLNSMGITVVQKPWQRLPNNPFSGFNPNT